MCAFFIVPACLLCSALPVSDESPDVQKVITKALISATQDADNEVRFAAFSALQDLPRSAAIVDVFRRGLKDGSPNIRALALSKLVDYEGATDEVLDQLIAAIGKPELKDVASSKLVKIGAPAAARLIKALEVDKTKLVAIDILGRLDLGKCRNEAAAKLTKLLRDDDRKVRIAAIHTLKRIAMPHRGFAKYLRYAVEYIAQYDTNKDGVLTEDEWSKMARNPKLADQDGNGRITAMEFAEYLVRGQKR